MQDNQSQNLKSAPEENKVYSLSELLKSFVKKGLILLIIFGGSYYSYQEGWFNRFFPQKPTFTLQPIVKAKSTFFERGSENKVLGASSLEGFGGLIEALEKSLLATFSASESTKSSSPQ
jgi:hypothetical protein